MLLERRVVRPLLVRSLGRPHYEITSRSRSSSTLWFSTRSDVTSSSTSTSTTSLSRNGSPPPSPTTKTTTVAILGGGLSGLASATYFLRKLSPEIRGKVKVVVFERRGRTGGWCHSVRLVNGQRVEEDNDDISLLKGTGDKDTDTIVFETGPRSIRPVGLQGWKTIELAHFLGLTPHVLTVSKSAPSAQNRYLYTPPTLTLLPSSILSVLRDVMKKGSLMRKVLPRLLLEPFRPRSKLHTSGHGDESVDSFFSRRFGKPLAEEMISGMIHGIYAGDSRRLSVRAVFPQLWEAEREFGSVILAGLFGNVARKRGWKEKSPWRLEAEKEEREMQTIKARIRSSGNEGAQLVTAMEKASIWGLQGGIQELTIRLKEWLEEQGVEFRVGKERGSVDEVARAENGEWTIRTPEETINASHLITTLPNLLPASFSVPRFPSTTVSVINLSFARASNESEPLFPPGFGYLIPRTVPESANPHRVLGVLFDTDVMPQVDTSPRQGIYKCSLILGGSYWLDKGKDFVPPSHEELVEASLETLALHFPEKRFPRPVHAYSHTHRDCIPQVPVNSRSDVLAFSKRLLSREGGDGRVGVVGGGFAAVGVNGAVKAASEVGTGFAEQVNELYLAEREDGHEGEGRGETKLKKGVKKAVRTGMEMWQL